LEYKGVDGKIIIKCIRKEEDVDGVEWIYMAQDRVHQRALVDTIMKLQVPPKVGNLTS
jgi:hypothetical protein